MRTPVHAAALAFPPGPRCPACTVARDARAVSERRHRRQRPPGRWVWLNLVGAADTGLRGRAVVCSVWADSPDLVIAMRLLDSLKLNGFEFRRGAPGEDGPLVGHRISGDRVDLILIEGFSRNCFAWRQRASPLIIPGSGRVERQIDGGAIDVLNEVLSWQSGP